MRPLHLAAAIIVAVALFRPPIDFAQSNFPPEEFSAIAMVNNNIASGAGRVIMRVTRWSSVAERDRLVDALVSKGPDELLQALMKTEKVGFIRTPDSLGYDLHFATQRPGEDGGRDIVIATDRPISFWEASNRPRTIDYPFTVVQMHIGRDGKGKGTLSYATKLSVKNRTLELEDFATSPAMLTEIEAEVVR